ncbi:hypothetical protein J4453_02620 [Candidatus Woesearchaeota archaeon]|nr:hypothetical protein [Candidatus Woesearchaeota archaeon]
MTTFQSLQTAKSRRLETRLNNRQKPISPLDAVEELRALVNDDFRRGVPFQDVSSQMGRTYWLGELLREYRILLGDAPISAEAVRGVASMGGGLYADHIWKDPSDNGFSEQTADDESKPEVVRNYLNG